MEVSLTGCRFVDLPAPAAATTPAAPAAPTPPAAPATKAPAPESAKQQPWHVGHRCSTERGSSGAPLVDYNADVVIALHHAGSDFKGNRAIAMSDIVSFIKQALPALPVVTQ